MKNLSRLIGSVVLWLVMFLSLPVWAQTPADESDGVPTSWAPFQIALIDPIQFFNRTTNIAGMRLNLMYGKNAEVWGLDVGLWSRSEWLNGLAVGVANQSSQLRGIQVGGANVALDDAIGLQAGVINGIGRDGTLVQLGVFNDSTAPLGLSNDIFGMQVGVLNMNLLPFAPWGPGAESALGETTFHGVELGLVNAKKDIHGLAIGAINTTDEFTGLQIGAINFSRQLKGVQLGFLNFATSARVPFFPGINANW